jgi:hypothetical protein
MSEQSNNAGEHTKVLLALGDGLGEDDRGVAHPASRTQSRAAANAFIVEEMVMVMNRGSG